MKIEDLSTEVRPRTSWESIDLGLRMVQKWYSPILRSWLLFVLPVCIVIYVLLYKHPFISVFVIWWLKPLFDRIPLYIVSHSVFGEIPTLSDIRRALPGLLKPHIIKMLFWYRLDPIRSFNLPVWQLEGLKGKARQSRARILQKDVYGTAVALTYFSILIQLILLSGCYAVVMMLLPTNVSANEVSIFEFSEGGILPGLILNIFAFISLSIIEPFYVASGFSLYLNRRTHLEAWDIELKFRSLAKRIGSNKASIKTVAVLVVSLFIVNSDINLIKPVYAKTTESNYTEISNKQAKSVINKILASDEFNKKIKTKNWQVKEGLFKDFFKDDEDNKKSEMLGFSIFGILISTILSYILYFLLGLVVLAALLFLLFKFFNFLPRGIFQFSGKKKSETKVATLFGMDLNPDSLPDEVGASAWVLWQSEKFLESLSLLYRGTLSKLVNRDGVKLPFSATEGDCIKILKSSHIKDNLELVNYFENLTIIWQRAAYAHRLPEKSEVKQICDSWSPLFHVESKT